MMDINNHPLHNKLYTKLKEYNTEMEEFTHKCWGPKNGIPIMQEHHVGSPWSQK
jgi:hypothetical protein